jgi:hypothetical protein
LRCYTDVAAGLARRLNDPAHGIIRHGGKVRRTGDRTFDRSVRHCQGITTHIAHAHDQSLGNIPGARNEPRAHTFCRVNSAFDHVTDYGDRLIDHAARRLYGIGNRIAYQVDDLRFDVIFLPGRVRVKLPKLKGNASLASAGYLSC